MLNNTKFAKRDLLFFNRIPKVGSEQLIELLHRLKYRNGFTVSRASFSTPVLSRMDKDELQELAYRLYDLGESHAYAMHVNYINFRKFGLTNPIYINLIRDPVERIISWFYYKRTPWNAVQMYKIIKKFQKPKWYKKSFEECVLNNDPECIYIPGSGFKGQSNDHKRQTLFFCGHEPDCEPFNTKGALELAITNVERDYAVVGSWEDLNITLAVLEHYIPKYFRGAKALYYDPNRGLSGENRNENPWKPKISKKIKNLIKQNFTIEYEFYNFCKQRLYKQYFAIKNRT